MLILNTKTFNFYMTADQLCAQAIHIETVKQTYSGYHCFQLAHLLAHCLHYNPLESIILIDQKTSIVSFQLFHKQNHVYKLETRIQIVHQATESKSCEKAMTVAHYKNVNTG